MSGKGKRNLQNDAQQNNKHRKRMRTLLLRPHASRLPETGFVTLKQIIGEPKANPPIPAIIPVKKSCWYDGIRSGLFPKPKKRPGVRISTWCVHDIRKLIATWSE